MNGVLKFLQTSPERTISRGKRCFPERSVGVSKQSPSSFQLRSTLVNPVGYVWTQPIAPKLFSHTTYVSAVGNRHTNNSFKEEHEKKSSEKGGFNKRKGLLSQFMDNHSWKKGVDKLMGFERSEESRKLKNIDIERNKSKTSENYQAAKTDRMIKSAMKQSKNSSFYETIPTKFQQMNSLRKSRNNLYEKQLAIVSSTKRRIKLKNNQTSILNEQQQVAAKPRLFYKEMMNTTRSQSQNHHQTIDNWFGSTFRSDKPVMKMRKSIEAKRAQPSRSVMEDGFYKEEIEEFQNKFLKSGGFKKSRSNHWSKMIEDYTENVQQ